MFFLQPLSKSHYHAFANDCVLAQEYHSFGMMHSLWTSTENSMVASQILLNTRTALHGYVCTFKLYWSSNFEKANNTGGITVFCVAHGKIYFSAI